MKKTYRKVKTFVQKHDEAFYMGAAIALSAAATTATIYLAAKVAEEQKEIDAWTREQNFAGKTVYTLQDGSYIAVSPEQVS